MKPSVLRLSRLFAWTAAVGGVGLLAFGYDLLPAEIPLTRWTTVAKTPLLVLRVPLINLLSLILVVILDRALVRAHAGSSFRDTAMKTLAVLYATVGLKAFCEAFELLMLPAVYPWMPWVL